jgi:hypothetical protein
MQDNIANCKRLNLSYMETRTLYMPKGLAAAPQAFGLVITETKLG